MPQCLQLQRSLPSQKGKERASKRDKIKCTNTNCGKTGYTKDQYYAKGGGKEKETPDWYQKITEKKAASASANIKYLDVTGRPHCLSLHYRFIDYSVLFCTLFFIHVETIFR